MLNVIFLSYQYARSNSHLNKQWLSCLPVFLDLRKYPTTLLKVMIWMQSGTQAFQFFVAQCSKTNEVLSTWEANGREGMVEGINRFKSGGEKRGGGYSGILLIGRYKGSHFYWSNLATFGGLELFFCIFFSFFLFARKFPQGAFFGFIIKVYPHNSNSHFRFHS